LDYIWGNYLTGSRETELDAFIQQQNNNKTTTGHFSFVLFARLQEVREERLIPQDSPSPYIHGILSCLVLAAVGYAL
jgi:hypothetical protein